MSWYDLGNPPITSTQGIIAAPSTASLIAELDSTELLTKDLVQDQHRNYRVTVIAGASTTATFVMEHTLSTGLGSTALVNAPINFYTPTGQSAQYVFNVRAGKDSRFRVRLTSTAANAAATIQAEPLT
jgi:cytoskeletal protein RodZ